MALPQDVLSGLETSFGSDPEAYARVLFFLFYSQAAGHATPYIQSLQAAVSIPTVFKNVAERLELDTRTAENDPRFRQVMHDVWNNFMKDDLSEYPDGGQRRALAISEKAYSFMAVSPTASNSDINSRYRQLALEYHPDRGGDPDKWTQLQYSMAVIREARGES